jgi:hypothetical protein
LILQIKFFVEFDTFSRNSAFSVEIRHFFVEFVVFLLEPKNVEFRGFFLEKNKRKQKEKRGFPCEWLMWTGQSDSFGDKYGVEYAAPDPQRDH